jgi:hypothetical protein
LKENILEKSHMEDLEEEVVEVTRMGTTLWG